MSIPVRHSGRIAFAALIVITLIAALLGVRMFAVAAAPPPTIDQPSFKIGPIEGLTTAWHWAPRSTSIPLGTIAEFFQPAPPDATVNWTGAAEVARDLQGSTAVCPLVQLGIAMVRVEVIPADGGDAFSSESRFNVVEVPIEQITVSAIDVWVELVEIDENLPQDEINEQTMSYFFDSQSIAALRDLGHGRYRTSVDRTVHMSVAVDPPGFAPLIEWRFGAEAITLGTATIRRPREIGTDFIEVGPLFNPAQAELEAYSVRITSHTSGQDIIEEGKLIVFIAETDPPGYENDITWLSSTKYGTAEPILGEGPIFIAEFNDTWGPHPDDPSVPFQWLGAKADNAIFNVDLLGGGCNPPDDGLIGATWCITYVGDATATGTINFKWTAKRADGSDFTHTMDLCPQEGWTCEDKANAMKTKMENPPHSPNADVCVNGCTLCFRLRAVNELCLVDITKLEHPQSPCSV